MRVFVLTYTHVSDLSVASVQYNVPKKNVVPTVKKKKKKVLTTLVCTGWPESLPRVKVTPLRPERKPL